MAPQFLQRLDLETSADERAIRRAYARELKKIDQEADPQGFQSLRAAYDAALLWARQPKEPPVFAAADPAPPSSTAAASYAQAKVVPQPKIGLMPAAPLDKDDPKALATAVFDQFIESLRSSARASATSLDAKEWQAKLEECLAGDSLVSFAARELFERKVADLLVRGWKPGHEVLLVVAARAFEWDEDRRRLQVLGRTGVILEHALHERAMYDRQHPNDRLPQRALIQRLRDPAVPTNEELSSSSRVLETLIRYFPTWLGLITDTGNIERWRELDSARPRTGFQMPEAALPNLASNKSRFVSLRWPTIVLLVLVIFTLRQLIDDHKPAPQPVPSQHDQLMHQEIQRALAPPAALPMPVPPPRHDEAAQQARARLEALKREKVGDEKEMAKLVEKIRAMQGKAAGAAPPQPSSVPDRSDMSSTPAVQVPAGQDDQDPAK